MTAETEIVPTLAAQIEGWWTGLAAAAPRLGMALALALLTWLAARLLRGAVARVGRRARLRPNLVEVLQMVAGTGAWFAGGLVALTVAFPTITPGRALTTLGLGSVAIGFAFKDTFENFLAGLLILLREPFRIGDFVECEGLEGRVETITIRDTHIRQTDGQLVVMPNHALFQNPVTVLTDQGLRRATIVVGVAYGEDVDRARMAIHDAVARVDSVRDDVHDVQVFAQAFGASSIDFEVAWWTGSTPLDIRASRDQVVAAVKRALDDAGIEIPFPYRTLTFKEPLRLARAAEGAGEGAGEGGGAAEGGGGGPTARGEAAE